MTFGPAAGMYEHHDGMGLEVFLTQFGGAFNLHKPISRWSDKDRADAARLIGVFKNLRRYLNKDFWSLFPQPHDREGWDGWQFHDPESGTGLLLFFKRRDCEEDNRQVELRWPEDAGKLRFGTVLGSADLTVESGGRVGATMDSRAALVRYEPVAGS